MSWRTSPCARGTPAPRPHTLRGTTFTPPPAPPRTHHLHTPPPSLGSLRRAPGILRGLREATARAQECAVEDVALQQGALYARCDRQGKFGPRSELCQRVGQGGYSYNNLACWPSVQTGVVVPLHTRKPGASHTLCGTAGINESRVQWYDGFQDDFFAYSASRRADGRLVKADVFKGELFGTDLLSPSELEVRGRTDILVAWRSTVVDMQGKFQRLFGADHSSDWRRRS